MELPLKEFIIMSIGGAALLVWLIIFMKSKQYDEMFKPLSEKEYPLKELYSTGYAVMEIINYRYRSRSDRRLRQEVEVLYGHQYVDFYLRVIYSQKVTYTMLVFLMSFVLYGISADVIILAVMLMFSGLAYYYFGTVVAKKISARSEELLSSFSEAISKLALLTNAGMILREAWEQVAKAGDGVLYQEMSEAVQDMVNGTSETEAIRLFGVRCIIPEIKKFSSTIIQGLTKGNQELAIMLQEQSKEVWGARKQFARRQGEKAASKLLIPILIMFIGILIMIIVPIFTNLGV